MKNKFFFLLFLVIACASPEGRKTIDKLPDNTCSAYHGDTCISPIIQDKAPDTTCHLYQGNQCVSPVVDKMPDSTCGMYSGETCVSPIIKTHDQSDSGLISP